VIRGNGEKFLGLKEFEKVAEVAVSFALDGSLEVRNAARETLSLLMALDGVKVKSVLVKF